MTMNKKKLIVRAAIVAVLTVGGVYAYDYYTTWNHSEQVHADNMKYAAKDQARLAAEAEKAGVDPISGVATSTYDNLDLEPKEGKMTVVLGFDKLERYGLDVESMTSVKKKLTAFAHSQEPKVGLIRIHKDSFIEHTPDEDGYASLNFVIRTDSDTDYNVDVRHHVDTGEAKVTIYANEEEKTEVFAQ